MDPNINFLVEVKTVSDLKDMCQLQVHVLLFPANVRKRRRSSTLSGCTTLRLPSSLCWLTCEHATGRNVGTGRRSSPTAKATSHPLFRISQRGRRLVQVCARIVRPVSIRSDHPSLPPRLQATEAMARQSSRNTPGDLATVSPPTAQAAAPRTRAALPAVLPPAGAGSTWRRASWALS